MTVPANLLTSTWVRSWIGTARPGADLHAATLAERAAAAAQFTISNLAVFDRDGRNVTAFMLPHAKFVRGNDDSPTPHLELAGHHLDTADPHWPARVAAAGVTVMSPTWRPDEIVAVRRALLDHSPADPGPVHDAAGDPAELRSRLATMADPLRDDLKRLGKADTDVVARAVTDDLTPDHFAMHTPALAELDVHATFDRRLAETNGRYAPRRIGVWHAITDNGSAAAVVPNLAYLGSSKADLDGPLALAVRLAVLTRVAHTCKLDTDVPEVAAAPADPVHLRAVPAADGQNTPHASVEAATAFVRAHPDAAIAWQALTDWAADRYTLTITADEFTTAHGRVATADVPDRCDVDVVLPLVWGEGRVARVTAVRS